MLSSHDAISPLTQEGLLHRIANRVRQSLELESILSTTAAEVRAYLGTDRVKIYQFYPDGHGVVVAESLQADRLPSLLGLHFPADDIPRYARELFVRARQRSIVDLGNHTIGISPLNCPETGEALNTGDIRYRPVDPCHQEYLTAMGVKSSIVVPIVLEGEASGFYDPPSLQSANHLWGLLVSHHAEPRSVTEAELQFIQAVVDQVAVAIAQSVLLEQVRSQARREANMNQVTARLQMSPTVDWQEALELASHTLSAGGRLYLASETDSPKEIYTCGEQPALIDPTQERSIEENLVWQKYLHSVLNHSVDETGRTPWSPEWMRAVYELVEPSQSFKPGASSWAVDDLYQEPLFRTLAPFFDGTNIRSALIIPLKHGTQIMGCLTFFRREIDTEIEWGGYHNPDTRQLMPRQSFEVWRQIKKGQAQRWTEEEIKYAQALGERFAATVKQYRLYQQVQSLNASLERQVEERTEALKQQSEQLQQSNTELERVVERQMTLSRIVAKIRESLDIDTIFQIATQSLSHVVTAERVAIYRFNADWGGAFIGNYEAVTPEWQNNGQLGVNTVWNDTHLQETQGGRYRTGDSSIVHDIYQQGYAQCHVEILEQFQVKAFMVMPIFVGQALWGLLGVYQHSAPRHWKPSEIEFVSQIAAQLGVALQHAELLVQTRQKTEQLAQTLNDLKQTQVQLFHSEKMSSLGQLVAGIAHEVNNPINFISGNLAHIQEYIQTLFELVRAYQQHTSAPSPDLLQLLEDSDFAYIEADFPKLCASMKMGTERIGEIVESLRNFSRVDEAAVKAVDLHEGLESTLLILQHRLKLVSGKPIEIEQHYEELPPVHCHAGQLNQVFMNLIGNAIDELETTATGHTSSKTVTISTRCVNADWVEVSIKDNGRGITPEIQAKLFDPFFTTKPIGKGTGLGLFISYQIVEKHGGQLVCHSQPGQGTEFVITLPVQ
ncbi:GAF domain-containing protein (plasmid) [Phormidium sp. CLA17]|uniref:GAF domain-containing protein n=1 Tax=Leptolyngbya sp. Cla-17 TaxID=2803751 RepID=UPI0014919B61|nr:GAF domain-containing protein [Leptolyngbya sp. Cla-17]MBM0744332.1 GAF domain-containing protein [Leptolyngbya sp. Cla-17]MBM0745244.1 GAF domain-containing protein [Leptolyngbya sp. Cla-17]